MAKRSSDSRRIFSLRRIILQRYRENRRYRLNDLEKGPSDHEISDKGTKYVIAQKMDTASDLHKSETTGSFREVTVIEPKEGKNCIICYIKESSTNLFFTLDICDHKFCISCLVNYLRTEINESRTDIACPQCSCAIHPNNIEYILSDFSELKTKYEDFMIRRYLVTDPDARWCPAPDCSYAVIASGCAPCPEIKCERINCGVSFCYHCKAQWHPDQTCDAARSSRQIALRTSSTSYSQDSTRRDEIKPCPRCQVLIVKMNDGSCNHMVCSVCGAEFCWLCMKEVSDLHYLSPSGCTFWGKKPWSRKKKIIWQVGTLIGAPVGVALLAGIAIPSILIGTPIWVGRKLLDRYKSKGKPKRNIFVTIGVIASILVSPLLAAFAVAIGVPILLFYVYGIVPISLCRASCASSNEKFKFDENVVAENHDCDRASFDAISRVGETSIGDISLSATSVSLIEGVNIHRFRNIQKSYRESTTALAGSVRNQKVECTDNISTESEATINVTPTI